jgi:hypothetical protein
MLLYWKDERNGVFDRLHVFLMLPNLCNCRAVRVAPQTPGGPPWPLTQRSSPGATVQFLWKH